MLGAKNLRYFALCLLLLSAQPANASGLLNKVISACERMFSPNATSGREPQSVKPEQYSADHAVINHVMDGPATGALFLVNSSEERINGTIGTTQEIPQPEIFVGEPQNIEKILNKEFVVVFKNEFGKEISEYGKLVALYPPDGQSWVETITILTDSNIPVEIPVADIIRLYELDRI